MREEIASTENRIAFARQDHNDSVPDYTNSVQQFTAHIIAGIFAFRANSLLEIDDIDTKRAPVQVKFN